jgi:mannitol/fructose-specific phosphotransferase system IIA component (Ntr-type)
MIDGFTLTSSLVQFVAGKHTWEEAIKISSQPLLTEGFITENYLQRMVDVVKEFGPYICIAPMIAMPHARPEDGSNKVGFCVTVFEEMIDFGEEDYLKARLFVSLSCTSADTHIQMMQALVDIIGDEKHVETILTTKDKQIILNLFQ